MKLTYHKITGVDKNVCTAEQKIAYNMAFDSHINFQEKFDAALKLSGAAVADVIAQIVDFQMKSFRWSYTYKPGKYNEDAICSALRAGLEDYLRKPFIAWDYAAVGKAFPAHYL